ncbi:head-tail connector protein [Ancylobacter sp. SL191]|uniref:head-tail connector protein n=1 Tax=Ancylobacter sp. SL191 TaxID=2995166 RepID=UPI00226E40B9|nr:head-tail connector protein [Ancylobacter sp. SL191]WAC25744.1 head-tail connector protein [Ancylobacter sp. SL191]
MTDTAEIVSLEDLKAHVVVEFDDDDVLLTAKLEAARSHIEAYVGPLDDFEGGVPEDVKEALRQLASHFYTRREAAQAEALEIIPFGVTELIGPYRKWEF